MLLAGSAFAQSYENGLYEISEQETSQALTLEDGTQYWLGDRIDVRLDENSVFSRDNSNEEFQVTLRYPSETPSPFSVQEALLSGVPLRQFALIVGDSIYVSRGSGGGNGQATIFFYLTGAENAESVAAYFGAEVLYRSHPGHRLLVRFSPQEQTVKLGDEVPVILEITNVGDTSFSFAYSPTLPFTFSATRSGTSVARTGWPRRANEISTFLTLEPSATRVVEANVANWLEFDEPGVYYVFGSYRMDFSGGGLPIGPRIVWSEQVSDTFRVTVER